MNKSFSIRYIMVALALLIILSSCGGNDEQPLYLSNHKETKTGVFIDGPVQGISYETNAFSGITDENGTFNYYEGEVIDFYVEGIKLGSATGKPVISPLDIVEGAENILDQEVLNICIFIQSLDEDSDPENGITISPVTRNRIKDLMFEEDLNIDFNQDTKDFYEDYDVNFLIGVLSAYGTIPGKTLLPENSAIQHFSQSLYGDFLSIEISPKMAHTSRGVDIQFKAEGIFEKKSLDITDQVTWSSSNISVVSFDDSEKKGLAKTFFMGTSQIKAELGGIYGTTEIEVRNSILLKIELTPTNQALPAINPHIPLGAIEEFTATGIYSDETSRDITSIVEWTSDSNDIVAVSNTQDSKGQVQTLSTGSAVINAEYNDIKGSIEVFVSSASLVSISVSPTNPSIPAGKTLEFKATGLYSDNTVQDVTSQVLWSSSDPFVAHVSNNQGLKGLATSLAKGIAMIGATYEDLSDYTLITVTSATLQSISIIPENHSISQGSKFQYKATGLYSDNTTQDITSQAIWSSTNDNIVILSNSANDKGLAIAALAGSATIKAKFGSIQGQANITVTQAVLQSIKLFTDNPFLPLGTSSQISATGIYSDNSAQDITNQIIWESSNPNIAQVSNSQGRKGFVTALSKGSTTIKAVFDDFTKSIELTITDSMLVRIEITPENYVLTPGKTFQFKASGIYSDNTDQDITKLVVWSSSSKSIATISNAFKSKGIVTTVSKGATTIKASMSEIKGSATLNVSGFKY